MRFLTFSGIDGSGKTTQRLQVAKYLSNEGLSVETFHLIDFSLANKINSLLNRSSSSPGAAVTEASKFSILLRKIFIIIDVFRFKFYYRKTAKSGYDYLITDRYFFDQIINILYLENNFELAVLPFWARIVLFFMITPTKAFYIDVLPQTALTRDKIPEQGIEYLKSKKMLYDILASKWKMARIDGNQDMNSVYDNILKSF